MSAALGRISNWIGSHSLASGLIVDGVRVALGKPPRHTLTIRSWLARHLEGDGIEIGALSAPLDLAGNARVSRVQYVDRVRKAELLRLFPELLPEAVKIREPDVLCEVNEGLTAFPDGSLDFVVACHLIEHLPDPIHFLQESWRVLCPGGRLFLAVPDRRYTATDLKRELTTLEHLLDDHRRAVRTVEGHHLADFVVADGRVLPADPRERERLFANERARSIHVHVWEERTFAPFLEHCIATWVPFAVKARSGPRRNERGEILYVLEKVTEKRGT